MQLVEGLIRLILSSILLLLEVTLLLLLLLLLQRVQWLLSLPWDLRTKGRSLGQRRWQLAEGCLVWIQIGIDDTTGLLIGLGA